MTHSSRVVTCDCKAARGEDLHGGLQVFDPVRGSRVELGLVTENPRRERRSTRAHTVATR